MPQGALDVTSQQVPPKVNIIIPAYNEEGTIPIVLSQIQQSCSDLNFEVIVVDAGSVDATSQIAKEFGAKIIGKEERVGFGDALKAGIDFALDREPDVVVIIDPDGRYPPSTIPKLIDPILDGSADIVQGTTFHQMSPARRIITRLLVLLMKLTFASKVTDPFTGLRAFSVDSLRNLHLKSSDASVFVELTIKASKRNLRVLEIPVSERPRIVRYPSESMRSCVRTVMEWLRQSTSK